MQHHIYHFEDSCWMRDDAKHILIDLKYALRVANGKTLAEHFGVLLEKLCNVYTENGKLIASISIGYMNDSMATVLSEAFTSWEGADCFGVDEDGNEYFAHMIKGVLPLNENEVRFS